METDVHYIHFLHYCLCRARAESEHSECGECLIKYIINISVFNLGIQIKSFIDNIKSVSIFSNRNYETIISSNSFYLILFEKTSEFSRIHIACYIYIFEIKKNVSVIYVLHIF